jgi:sulfonate transport system substrate-binding protein
MSITIGVHGANPSLYHLSRLGILEELLRPLGESVEWLAVGGTSTGEALADGTIDFGGTGSTPPLSAQAAGHDLVYTAVSAPRPGHGALLVAADGPVAEVTDLKGGTVVLAVGSWQTHFTAKALAAAGLSYRDITAERPGPGPDKAAQGNAAQDKAAQGNAAQGNAARLRSGEIAGWVAQGAELAAARRQGGVRTLLEAGEVITDRSVFFTRRDFAEQRPELVAVISTALQRADDWAAGHLAEAAAIAAADQGGTVEDWQQALAVLPWRLEPVSEAFIAEQQEAADILAGAGYLPRAITVADAHLPALAPAVRAALEG